MGQFCKIYLVLNIYLFQFRETLCKSEGNPLSLTADSLFFDLNEEHLSIWESYRNNYFLYQMEFVFNQLSDVNIKEMNEDDVNLLTKTRFCGIICMGVSKPKTWKTKTSKI